MSRPDCFHGPVSRSPGRDPQPLRDFLLVSMEGVYKIRSAV